MFLLFSEHSTASMILINPFAVVPALHSVYFIIHNKSRLAIASPLLEIRQEEPVCFIYALRGPLHSKSCGMAYLNASSLVSFL